MAEVKDLNFQVSPQWDSTVQKKHSSRDFYVRATVLQKDTSPWKSFIELSFSESKKRLKQPVGK